MKKAIAAGVLMLSLALTGCTDTQLADKPNTGEHTVLLEDGRSVTCVAWKAGYAGGFSCDWEGAK